MTRFTRAAVASVLTLTALTAVGVLADPPSDDLQRTKEIRDREQAAKNLEQIGKAILQYQQQNSQLYPRTILPVLPTTGPTTVPATTLPVTKTRPAAGR